MAKVKNTTIINAKRIQEIVNYDLSLGMLVNPNIKQQLVLNPIGVKVALKTQKELREALEGFDIDIKEIDCNRVFCGNTELSEIEVFIRSINSYLNYRNDYMKILQTKELDKDFSREERQKLADDLEEEIKKDTERLKLLEKSIKPLEELQNLR